MDQSPTFTKAMSYLVNFDLFLTDAFVGGLIGLFFAYICYRQHYPPILDVDCHLPYASLAGATAHNMPTSQDQPLPMDNATSLPLEGMTEGPVWLIETPQGSHPSDPLPHQCGMNHTWLTLQHSNELDRYILFHFFSLSLSFNH